MHGSYVSLIFLLIPLFLVYLLISRTRRQQRVQAAVQAAIEPGHRVMTTSGLYGTVVSVEQRDVVLEIAPGVHTRWVRLAIGQVLEPTDDDDDDLIDDDAQTTDNHLSDQAVADQAVAEHAVAEHAVADLAAADHYPDDRTLT